MPTSIIETSRRIAAPLLKAAAIAALAVGIAAAPGQAAPFDVGVNPDLVAFNKRFQKPELVNVAPGVHVAFGYSYSNFSFIEGKTGLILIDTGWFQPGLEAALKDIRRISGKPISAIVFTHNHEDHTGGGGLALEHAIPDVPIFAVAGFALQRQYDAGPTRLLIQERNFAQTGLPLTALGYHDIYASVGALPDVGIRREIVPNRFISEATDLTVDGVKLRFIPGSTDVSENMMVWMPDTGVLFIADAIGGIFPYIETPRYEPRRNPRAWVETLTTALSLQPKTVVAGHGRIVAGAADVQTTLAANRETIEYTLDQVERMLLQGRSAEQILHDFRLPTALQNNKDLQPFYHSIDWVLRGLIVKRVGYFTDLVDLVRLNGVDEAARLVQLAGGRDALLQAGEAALAADDARWAARIARSLQYVDASDAGAKALWENSLLRIASQTRSTNERNYALTQAEISRGTLDLASQLRGGMAEGAKDLSNDSLLFSFKTRFHPERLTAGERLCIGIVVDGQPAGWFDVTGSVLRHEPQMACQPDATLALTRQTLIALYAGTTSWADAIAGKQITASGSPRSIDRLAALLD